MGKDLQGKEIGRGLRQREDKKYIARFLAKTGKRPEKAFDKLTDAKRWLNEQRYLNDHSNIMFARSMTLNAWYEYWYENIKKPTIRNTSLITYAKRYENNIKPVLGNMLLSDIKPLHCQMVLNNMDNEQSTQQLTRATMRQIFNSAVENELLDHSPVTKAVKVKKTAKQERRVFTLKEQNVFSEYVTTHNHRYADAYLFCLETGLRIGELRGLMWGDISDNKIIVRRNIVYIGRNEIVNEPKTEAGHRIIPLTSKAREILSNRKKQKIVSPYVFSENGEYIKKSRLNGALATICKRLNMEHISMHGLRHSFATRCIERGMNPKTLQMILGHSSLSMTMDLYVHVTEETLEREMIKMESGEIGEKVAVSSSEGVS